MALCEQLTDRGRPGDVVALAPGRDGARLGVPVLGTAPRSPSTLRALRRRCATADVVVAHGSATLWAATAAMAGQAPRAVIYLSIGDPRFWADTRARRWRTGIALRRTAAVVALSPSAAATLCAWYDLPRQHVHVLPNVRSADRFRPATHAQRSHARRAAGLRSDAEVVLVLGALTPEKRPVAAITAALALPGVQVLVAGDGPLRGDVALLAARHPERVRFLGAVEDARPVLHAADALLLASASEGLPGVIVEAGLSGLPTAAPAVGWVGDLVIEGETGSLAPALDEPALSAALRRALDDRAALGAAARIRCLRDHTDEAVLPGWVRLIDAVSETSTSVLR